MRQWNANAGLFSIGQLGTNFSKSELEYETFHSRWKCIWKCLRSNGGHFVQGWFNPSGTEAEKQANTMAVDGLGPVSISEKTSFRKISSSLEAARFVFRIVRSLWNLTGTSAAVLPMCLSNFKAIRQFKVPISWLRDLTRSYEKTSFRILRRGPWLFGSPIHQQP